MSEMQAKVKHPERERETHMAKAMRELSVIDNEQEEAKAEIDIWKLVFGFVDMAVVKCAIELGIAEAIDKHGGGPITINELSSTLNCTPSSLQRIMRILVSLKIFKEKLTSQGSIGYIQTPLSARLIKDAPNSMAAFVLLESTPVMLAPWHSLSARARANGRPAFEATHGNDVWRYAAVNADHSRLINEAMACDARLSVPAIIEGCPEVFDGVNTLVDVGGGDGTSLRLLVKAFPWIQGINFDLPHVVAVAPEIKRVKNVAGDMFECVPKADAAFIQWVLHDWSDEECIQILKRCREAVPKDKGKVIIAEAVVKETEEEKDELEHVRLMLDMVMMAHTNYGKERTFKEWKFVLEEAGFRSFIVKPTRAVQSVIVAFP